MSKKMTECVVLNFPPKVVQFTTLPKLEDSVEWIAQQRC